MPTIPLLALLPALLLLPVVEPPASQPGAELLERIRAALPDKAPAAPRKPRKLLIFTATRGYRHDSIPTGVAALTRMGEKTGAYTAVHSEDPAVFEPDSLSTYDAVVLLSTTGELFTPPDFDQLDSAAKQKAEQRERQLKESFKAFVETGHGLVGIHAATDTLYKWDWYGQAIGGYFDGHPWNEDVTILVEDPKSPLTAAFDGKPLRVADEIYQFREPWSRERLRVLLRLDPAQTDMKKDGIHRTDGDFAVSWVRRAGSGRVFYCSLGHRDEIYANPLVLRHYLAGIQFALGDLECATDPIPLARNPGANAAPRTTP